MKEMTKDFYIF